MTYRIYTLLIAVTVAGCAVLPGPSKEYKVGYQEKGVASWYGEPFHGRRTANGEIYDMFGMTAAHRLMPLGTSMQVKNLNNDRTVTVRVNDRGPFVRGRILDLSYQAAHDLDMVRSGTAPIKLRVIEISQKKTGLFTIQVGSFAVKESAGKLLRKLRGRYDDVFMNQSRIGNKTYYRVRVGKFSDVRLARKTARKLRSREGLETFVMRLEL